MTEKRYNDLLSYAKSTGLVILTANELEELKPVVRCKDCYHRDPEDHKCDCGALERAGSILPVDDDYFCKYGVSYHVN